jgi:hypothetical protein
MFVAKIMELKTDEEILSALSVASVKLIEANKKYELDKLELKILEAQLDRNIRLSALGSNRKLTEAGIEAEIVLDPVYQAKKKLIIDGEAACKEASVQINLLQTHMVLLFKEKPLFIKSLY